MSRRGLIAYGGRAALGAAVLALLVCRPLYELFLNVHTVPPIVTMIAVWPHVNIRISDQRAYIFVSLGALATLLLTWTLVTLFRRLVLKRQCGFTYIKLRGNAALLEMNMTRSMTIKSGQFGYLWMPSTGFWSIFQTHPFMISWQDEKTLWALVQPQRDCSRRLKYLADEERRNLVWLDGPYGNPPTFSDY